MASSSNGRRNPIRSSRRRSDTIDEDAGGPWAHLHTDILMMIVMKLGFIDFLAFRCVCKQWRSSALSNQSTFFAQKEPLLLTMSKNSCTFKDIFDERRRRYKTIVGGSDPSRYFCVLGISCGYLIICRKRSSEIYLVNPITRDELCFPPLPKNTPLNYASFRPIIVCSSLSKFIVVILYKGANNQNLVIFSGSGDSEWVFLPNPGQDLVDLAFFKGKIYLLNRDGSVGEMKLNPLGLHLLNVKKMPSLQRELISSGEWLLMVDNSSRITVKHEFDFENMEWVVKENLGGDSLFINSVKSSAVVSCTNWPGRGGKVQCNSTYSLPQICGVQADLLYFPHDCCSKNCLEDS